ncbi:HAD-IC family P-type ATPase [Streptococcus suis]|nr:HAD-IC family P-type ATPase [Streptococcus suis]
MEQQPEGLSSIEVLERIKYGYVNQFTTKTGTSIWEIFSRNFFTPFNLLNFLIFLALVSVQAWFNLFFFGAILIDAFSGMFIEWRARRMIDKLNLMNKEKIRVIRNGDIETIEPENIVLDDLLLLSAGEQVPSDARVLQGVAEVNEAMLTGESDLILKQKGAELLSGSHLVSGQVYAQTIHVGGDNYSNQLMLEAKANKVIFSDILFNMDKIAGFTSKIIVPFGFALFFESYILKELSLKDAVVTSSTALLGMLPKGIALLFVTALLTSVIKLGMKKVLVQDMYSIETLARVDMLCLDKTGTITQGKMSVKGIALLTDNYSEKEIEDLLSIYVAISDDNNATSKAVRKRYYRKKFTDLTGNYIPFSSARKWGAVYVKQFGTLFLGAPDILLDHTPQPVLEAQKRGSRTLILGMSSQIIDKDFIVLPSDIQVLACLEIADPIRTGVQETLNYLRSQKVDLKIISGDNPVTVSYIAKQAGFENYRSYIDCSKMSDEQLVEIAEETAIFGRVSPHQKKLLIETLKSNGHTTAMTGDGVNDILALREADCSIVMAEGDPAVRQIANLVLLKSDFNDIPEIIFEGRRVINNITHVAPIFLIKSIYSFILGLFCIASMIFGKSEYLLVFPFIQVQMTLIGQFVEGFPPFILTFERNIAPVEKYFLKRSLRLALPNALILIFSILLFHLLEVSNFINSKDMLTLSYYMLGTTGLLAVIRACFPLNKIRLGLLIYAVSGFFITSYFLRDSLEIINLNQVTLPIYIVVLIGSILFFIWYNWNQSTNKKLEGNYQQS